jgi:hypothetical protein
MSRRTILSVSVICSGSGCSGSASSTFSAAACSHPSEAAQVARLRNLCQSLQNLRRGHYELAVDTPRAERVAAAFTELARAGLTKARSLGRPCSAIPQRNSAQRTDALRFRAPGLYIRRTGRYQRIKRC